LISALFHNYHFFGRGFASRQQPGKLELEEAKNILTEIEED
jgi:hypothetical protein